MPPAGIAEQQVTEEAGGGAVREDAIGTHRFSRPSGRAQLSFA
jgi:bacillopeptidase F (M6 metalloprotease family)